MSVSAPADSSDAIVVNDLVREFGKGVRAVDGIHLSVPTGEIYGFLGPNGAGKSTTVKMLVTLLPPSGGTATVGGFDIARQGAKVRKVIGVALQDAALDPNLTAHEHMRLQAGLHGFSRAESKRRGDILLERVALTGAADRKVGGYSGGMKRRLDLALALVHSPRIVFLDEPTTGLDPQSRAALWDEVARLAREEGVTIFLTTQYLEEADVLAKRVGIIDKGKLVAEGTPEALKAEIGRPTVEIVPAQQEDRTRLEAILLRFGEATAGSPEGVTVRLSQSVATVPDIVRSVDSAGIAIANLNLRAPTLDDVFLEKTGRSLEGADAEAPEAEPVEKETPASVVGGTAVVVADWLQDVRHAGSAAVGTRPQLLVREGPLAGESIPIDGPVVLGREGDVVLDDPEVSRRHATFRLVEGSLVIEDLRSLNGTWVNGQRITLPTRLSAGDTVTLGTTLLEVQPGSAPAASPASAEG